MWVFVLGVTLLEEECNGVDRDECEYSDSCECLDMGEGCEEVW